MKNVMMSLMFLIIMATGVNAKTINSFDEKIPLPVQSIVDNLSSVTDTLTPNGPISIADSKVAGLELKLYPNPTSTNLTVSLDCKSNTISEPVFIHIIDMRGRIVLSVTDITDPGNTYRKDIDIRGLPDDEYVFQLIKGNRKLMKKFQVYY
jgi:hypothetical protein